MEATDEQKSILERVVVNAMRVMSNKETSPKVMGFLTSGKSTGEGFSLALTYVLKTVISGLLKKGVDVAPEVLMSENGGASQVAQLIVALIESQGGDITPNEIQKGLEVGLQNFGTMMNEDAAKAQQPQDQQAQPPQQQQPQQAAVQQQPQQGMLASHQGGAQ